MDKTEESLLKLFDSLFNLTDKQHQEILLLYKQSRENIQQFVAELFTKYGQDGTVNIADVQKYNRLQSVEEQIKTEMKNLVNVESVAMTAILGSIFTISYYKTAYTMEQSIGVQLNFKLLKKEFINEVVNFNWSGVPFSERIYKNLDALTISLRTELTQSIVSGETIDKTAKRIQKQFDIRAYESQRLVRTESARVISSAQENLFSDSGVVQKVKWSATLDNRTSKICRSRDGKTWEIDDPQRPKIPAHPNCRSVWIPVIDGYSNKKRKDNVTKQLIDYKNYDEWYKERVEN